MGIQGPKFPTCFREVFPPHHQVMLLTPGGCATIQLNFDTVWRQGQIPQVKGSVLQDYFSLQMPTASPDCHLCFWPTGHRLEVPRTPSSGSINLLERLTELRETLYLLYYKSIWLRTAKWKGWIEHDMWKGHQVSTPSPGAPLSLISMCSPIWKLSKPFPFFFFGFYRGFITEAGLIKSLVTNSIFSSSPFPKA